MDFSNNDFDNINNDADHKGDNIIILKRVKSVRQLRNSNKEWVKLCYKESVLKGFTVVKDIQCYIASKTKIWIERTGIEFLKKSEEIENKKWYYYMAKDHFAYVGAYRKAVDEIEQYKRELWSMMTDPDTTNMEKVQIAKELHNLTKTFTLLLRDLPFVTNLSKYYNLDLANPNPKRQGESQNPQSNNNNEVDKELIEQKVSERLRKMIDESALFSSEQKRKMDIISQTTDGDMKIDDHIMVEMRKQLNCNLKDVLESINNKDYQESIKKLKEIRED